jgi:hypothetical protein
MNHGEATTVHRIHLRHAGAETPTRSSIWLLATAADFAVLLIGIMFWLVVDVAATPHRAFFDIQQPSPNAAPSATVRVSLVFDGEFRVEIPSTSIVKGQATKVHPRCGSSELVSLVAGTFARDPNILVAITVSEDEPWHHVQETLNHLLHTGAKYASLNSNEHPAIRIVPRREPPILAQVFRATSQ